MPNRIEPLPREELAEFEDGLALIEGLMGFVPTSMHAMARVPGLVPAFLAMGNAAMANGLLPPGLPHMISHVTSYGAGCRYCQAHTAHTVERNGLPAEKVAELWNFENSDLFDDAERAALRIAFGAGQSPNAVTDEDFERAREFYDDAQLAAIVAAASFFGYLNRWNDTVATALEDEPLAFAAERLGGESWEPGKHAG